MKKNIIDEQLQDIEYVKRNSIVRELTYYYLIYALQKAYFKYNHIRFDANIFPNVNLFPFYKNQVPSIYSSKIFYIFAMSTNDKNLGLFNLFNNLNLCQSTRTYLDYSLKIEYKMNLDCLKIEKILCSTENISRDSIKNLNFCNPKYIFKPHPLFPQIKNWDQMIENISSSCYLKKYCRQLNNIIKKININKFAELNTDTLFCITIFDYMNININHWYSAQELAPKILQSKVRLQKLLFKSVQNNFS